MNNRQAGLLAVILIALVLVSDAYFATRPPQIIVNGGGQSYFQCLQPLNWLLCYPNPASNTTNICTAVNVGTSSCTLPQNGCDGVLRAYGRCNEGQVTITVNAGSAVSAGTATFAVPFTNTPTRQDAEIIPNTSGLALTIAYSYILLGGGTNHTWVNFPVGLTEFPGNVSEAYTNTQGYGQIILWARVQQFGTGGESLVLRGQGVNGGAYVTLCPSPLPVDGTGPGFIDVDGLGGFFETVACGNGNFIQPGILSLWGQGGAGTETVILGAVGVSFSGTFQVQSPYLSSITKTSIIVGLSQGITQTVSHSYVVNWKVYVPAG